MSEMFKINMSKEFTMQLFFIQKWVKTKLFYLHTNLPIFTGIIPFSELKSG